MAYPPRPAGRSAISTMPIALPAERNAAPAFAAEAAAEAAPLSALGPPSSAYLSRIVLVSTLGGLLFGLDTGIASGMLVSLRSDLGHVLSAREQGVFVCATTVGAIAGALGAGKLADWRGRRSVSAVEGCAG
jgi:SP family myo-inositol transporter-like MFS transporter 13